MARFAAVENGVVIGIWASAEIPVEGVPKGRTFVDVTDHPAILGGEHFDGEMFSLANGTLDARITKLEQAMVAVVPIVAVKDVTP